MLSAALLIISLSFFAWEARSAESAKTGVKKVVVAVASGNKPLSYEDESGNLVGYETDALRLIDELIPEYEFDLQSVEDDAQQIGLDTGKYALIAEGLFKTPERVEKYLLPDENIGVSLIKIVIRGNETTIKGLDDLIDKKVAPVSPNGGIFNLLTSYNNSHERKIAITTQEGLSPAESFSAVAAGKYDAVVRPSLGFEEIKTKLKLDIKQTDPVKVNNTYFVLPKSQADLAGRVSGAIKTLKNNGKLSELSKKYFEGEDILQYKEF
jgi:ABC-type amino acid transport substrate-binding protein